MKSDVNKKEYEQYFLSARLAGDSRLAARAVKYAPSVGPLERKLGHPARESAYKW